MVYIFYVFSCVIDYSFNWLFLCVGMMGGDDEIVWSCVKERRVEF